MIVIKLFFFSTLFCITLGFLRHNHEIFLHSLLGREKSPENNSKDLTQESNIKENDQFNDRVKYVSREPPKSKHIDENNSSDSSTSDLSKEISYEKAKKYMTFRSFDNKIYNYHKMPSSQNKSKLKYKENTINVRESNEVKSIDEDENSDFKTNTNDSNDTSKIITFSNYEVTECNLKKKVKSMNHKKACADKSKTTKNNDFVNSTELIKSVKENNTKIQHLMAEFNNLVRIKRSILVENVNEIDIQRLIKESILQKWKAVEVIVKFLLIDNYRFMQTTLFQEIVSNKKYQTRDISRLKKKLLQLYYILKRDILQTVKLIKIQFRREVLKQKLNKQQVYEVEQLYIAKLKEQIDTKIIVFKQNTVLVIEQSHLELKPVIYYTTTEVTTTREPSTEIPFDSVYESTTLTDNTTLTQSTTNISTIGHVPIEHIPLSTSTLTEVDNTNKEEDLTPLLKKIKVTNIGKL